MGEKTMAERAGNKATDRRSFLKLAGLGTVGTAAVLAGESERSEAAEPTQTEAGYRETEHVRAFYRSARF